MFSKEFEAKPGYTKLSWKKYLLPRKSRNSHRSFSVKEDLQGPAQVLSCECCEIFKNTYFQTHQWMVASENQHFRQSPNFIFLLNLIRNLAMTEWFSYVTCFRKIFLLLLFHYTHTASEMLSFLHRWDYCWKCEFDTDVKTE